MEFLIGRDAAMSRLAIVVDGGPRALVGPVASVPKSVSREHCRIVKTEGGYEIFNHNAENATYVNGIEVEQRVFNPAVDHVELGSERFLLNVAGVLAAIGYPPPPPPPPPPLSFSIDHLEQVWNDYHGEKLNMQIKSRKANAMRSVTGIFSMSAVACGFMPGLEDVVTVRIILYALGFGLMVYFFVKSYLSSSKEPEILDALDKQLHKNYICPNTGCNRFLGYQPYSDVKIAVPACPACGCRYTHRDR